MKRRPCALAGLVAMFGLVGILSVNAYDFTGGSWPSGTIPLQLQLGAPSARLIDGTTDWDSVGVAALETWNTVLQRSRFTYVRNSTAAKNRRNQVNNVFFDSTAYGDAFGSRVLAVTLSRRGSNGSVIESDVVVNNIVNWNSYRGSRRSPSTDLQRVLLHEFGHVLGLDHPDQASPPQRVSAIMNSSVSDVYQLQNDDVAGIDHLYGDVTRPPSPGSLASITVSTGSPLLLALTDTNSANNNYTWTFTRANGAPQLLLDGDGNPWTQPTFQLFSAQSADAGTYSVAATNGSATSQFVSAEVSVTPISTAGSRLPNLSARARAGSGVDTFIVGFVVNGNTPKRVMIRAVGPTLANTGVSSPLLDPKLQLFKRNADGSSTQVGENDNWSSVTSEADGLRAATVRLGASGLPDGSKDAALLLTLSPGVYSAVADAQGHPAGTALVEAYDADDTSEQSLTRPLVNLSTRSFAGAGDQTLIAGFVVDGSRPKQVLIRAIGPGLIKSGISNANTDPNLLLFQGSTQIADNDDWAYSNQTDILPEIFARVGATPLEEESYDSALLITLPPGVYSAQASGRSGETGTVLLEIYDVTP